MSKNVLVLITSNGPCIEICLLRAILKTIFCHGCGHLKNSFAEGRKNLPAAGDIEKNNYFLPWLWALFRLYVVNARKKL
jgi:hypothetical protein